MNNTSTELSTYKIRVNELERLVTTFQNKNSNADQRCRALIEENDKVISHLKECEK